jgi:hypothetical protein
MISNLFKATLILSLFLTGCSEFLKGKPEKKDVLEIKQESLSCLKTVSLEVSKFLKSESTQKEIDATFNCITETLTEFQSRVEGSQESGAFSADELFQIFEKFVKDAQVSRAAVTDLLNLKSALIGGSDQKITKTEISILKDFIAVVKVEAKNILPFAQILTLPVGNKNFSKKMIQDGFLQLNLSLNNLLKASKLHRSDYSFEDFKLLLRNLNLINESHDALIEIANKMNELIIGGQSLTSEADHTHYIRNLTEALKIYMYQRQGYVDFSFANAEGVANTIQFLNEIVDFFESTVQFKKTSLIQVETIDPVLTRVHAANIFPIQLSLDTTLNFYKTILSRVFGSGLAADLRAFRGLERQHFTNIRRELTVFQIYSEFLAGVASDSHLSLQKMKRLTIAELQIELKKFKPAESRALKKFDLESQIQIIMGVQSLQAQMNSPKPPTYRFNKFIIAHNQDIWHQNWQDLMKGLNYMMVSRLMLIGWGDPQSIPDMSKAQISEQGIVQWFSEFRNFGIETKAFDPRTENGGLSNLKAANLFTQASNSDNKMSYAEAIEQNSILMTAGSVISKEMMAGFAKANCQLSEKDVFENQWNNEACALQDIKKNYKYYFLNMPYLVGFLKKMNNQQFDEFYELIMQVARRDAKNKGVRLETADVKALSSFLHYIDSLFAIFDKNKDSLLSVDEIRASYAPRFKEFATSYAQATSKEQIDKFKTTVGYGCYTQDHLVKESFVFLVLNQRTPAPSDFNLLPCNPVYQRELIKIEGSVDRKGIINTFKILKSVLG